MCVFIYFILDAHTAYLALMEYFFSSLALHGLCIQPMSSLIIEDLNIYEKCIFFLFLIDFVTTTVKTETEIQIKHLNAI